MEYSNFNPDIHANNLSEKEVRDIKIQTELTALSGEREIALIDAEIIAYKAQLLSD